jgi:hypothetical protein
LAEEDVLRLHYVEHFAIGDLQTTSRKDRLEAARRRETLADARAMILSLPEHQQRRPYWEYAAQLLMDAAQDSRREAIDEAYWRLMGRSRLSDDGIGLGAPEGVLILLAQ